MPSQIKIHPSDVEEHQDHQDRVEEFSNGVSILGVKYVFKKDISHVRRVIWLACLLFGIGFLFFHLHNRITYYTEWPTFVKTEMEPLPELDFPTVTICSTNPYRVSSLRQKNETRLLRYFGVYEPDSAISEQGPSNLSAHSNVELYKIHGHKLKDMLVSTILLTFSKERLQMRWAECWSGGVALSTLIV